MNEYYPFRQFLMPEICPSQLTHRLMPSISTGHSNGGSVSCGTVLAEVEQVMADDGAEAVGRVA